MAENRILVINAGSSSIKISLFDGEETNRRLIDVHLKGLKTPTQQLTIESSRGKESLVLDESIDIPEALKRIFEVLKQKFDFQFSSLRGIGHRFVHGGSRFAKSIEFSSSMRTDLEELLPLAPLHNPSCLAGLLFCHEISPKTPQVIVFDTAFHSSMPLLASRYAIPLQLGEQYQIKRYGFHGIAHANLWHTYTNQVRSQSEKPKIITLQLGNGCSMTAIAGGKSMDTSMGFSPAEGLVMATRAGDIDTAVMEYLCRHGKYSPEGVLKIFNSKSGLLGVSGASSDMEALLKLYPENENVRLAIDLFCYRIVKYLGAYLAVLGGAEAVIFSGGIGENASFIRQKIVSPMAWQGWQVDDNANQLAVGLQPGMLQKISARTSSMGIYVAAADENAFIAAEVSILTKEK